MALTFPTDGTCDTAAEKLAFLYRTRELLRRLHNAMGAWRRGELTQAQYGQLPQRIRNRYPWVARLSQADFVDYFSNVHMVVEGKIAPQISTQRDALGDATTWTPDPTDALT